MFASPSFEPFASDIKRKYVSIAMLLGFFGVRFGLDRMLNQTGDYSSYLFETVYVFLAGAYYWKRLKFLFSSFRRGLVDGIIGLLGGALVYKLASPLSLIIPFLFQERQTIVMLLIVSPLLEEGLFRMALWEPIADLMSSSWRIIFATSLIFSFAHFFAWWSVPKEFHPFVLYLAIYVFFLAAYCGLRRYQTGSFAVSIFVHFAFNLGFYIGYLT